jgi:hypothetical protein
MIDFPFLSQFSLYKNQYEILLLGVLQNYSKLCNTFDYSHAFAAHTCAWHCCAVAAALCGVPPHELLAAFIVLFYFTRSMTTISP